MIISLYKHTNKINGKVYIGQTCREPKKRWANGQGYKTSPHFYLAIEKYGWYNFEHEILFTTESQEEANQAEIRLIQEYQSTNPKYGYNLDAGGHNGFHSEETKKKMSYNQQGKKNSFYGHRHSNETKKKISLAESGSKHHNAKQVQCIETGKVFSTLTEAAIWCNNANFRGKISEACRGRRQSAGKHPDTGEKLHWRYVEI